MTRQRKKQIENKAKGICIRCGWRKSVTKLHCLICRIKVNQLAIQHKRRSMVKFKTLPGLSICRNVAQFMKTESYLVDMLIEHSRDYERVKNMLALAKLQYTISEVCAACDGVISIRTKGE